jgi:opacity protein-like surface antigen
MSLLASLRGRLGVTLDPKVLVYVTGGLGYTRAKGTAFNSVVSNSASFNSFGGVVGAGAEWKQNQNFSWRLEGLWYFFDKSRNIFVVTDQNVELKLKDAVVVRFGGTFHY